MVLASQKSDFEWPSYGSSDSYGPDPSKSDHQNVQFSKVSCFQIPNVIPFQICQEISGLEQKFVNIAWIQIPY